MKTNEQKKEKKPPPKIKNRYEKKTKSIKEKMRLSEAHRKSAIRLQRKNENAVRTIPSPSEYGTGRMLKQKSAAFAQKISNILSLYEKNLKNARQNMHTSILKSGPAAYISMHERAEPQPTSGYIPVTPMRRGDTLLPRSFAHKR